MDLGFDPQSPLQLNSHQVVLSCVVFFFVICLILGVWGRGQDRRESLPAMDTI